MTTPKTPQDRKVKAVKESTPSEIIDAEQDAAELREKLLADMPALRPARRFRLAHRNAFHNLSLEAIKSGAFDGDDLDFDTETPEGIERYQKFQEFIVSIDEWAESIADDPAAYATWSEGKDEETFMALFFEYKAALGESKRSEN